MKDIYYKNAFDAFNKKEYSKVKILCEKYIEISENNEEIWHLLGISNSLLGELKNAIFCIEKALKIDKNKPHFQSNLGKTYLQLKDYDRALKCFNAAIELDENNYDHYYNKSLILQEINEYDEALQCINNSIKLQNNFYPAYFVKANLLKIVDLTKESLEIYKFLIRKIPNSFEPYVKAAEILKETDSKLALKYFKKAQSLNPKIPEVYFQIGNIYSLSNQEKAINYYKKSIKINPNFMEAYINLGNCYGDNNLINDAIINFEKAIAINPNFAPAYLNLANVRLKNDEINEALNLYDKSIKLDGNYLKAFQYKGNALLSINKINEAASCFIYVANKNPNYPQIYSDLGNVFLMLRRYNEAIQWYQQSIIKDGESANTYSNISSAENKCFRYVDAVEASAKCIEIDPLHSTGLMMHALNLAHLSNYEKFSEYINNASKASIHNSLNEYLKLYIYIYNPDLNSEEIVDTYKQWGDSIIISENYRANNKNLSKNKKLKIGYVSPDFRSHSCRFYFEPLFSNHNHENFEIFAYSNVQLEDEHTNRFKGYFDVWRNIYGCPDNEVAQQISTDEIDVLIDACGHMSDTRLRVFAYKPAPIQVTWLGSAWTTGLPQMDYALFDPFMAPVGTAASEQIFRLPRTWTAFRPSERAKEALVRISPVTKNGYVTFGYSGRTERLNHRVLRAWGRILARLPQARLLLDYKPFVDPKTQAYYQVYLQAHGVDTSRVLMRNSENVYEGLGDIDILLDSFPHNGGTMLFDAIWMGVPVLTLTCPRPVGRIGTSLMTNLGLPEWVAKDEQEYEDKAVEFAQDINALANLRSGMRARMQASPVMDEKGFAEDVEAAFKTMWSNWVDSSKEDLFNERKHK